MAVLSLSTVAFSKRALVTSLYSAGLTLFYSFRKFRHFLPDKVERVESVKYQGAPAHCSLVNPCAIALPLFAPELLA
jgi:hypothetical protein